MKAITATKAIEANKARKAERFTVGGEQVCESGNQGR